MSRITKSAKGEKCQVRIPGVCNYDPSTTVFAHLNGGGMGIKKSDLHGAYCCSACHDAIDGRSDHAIPHQTLALFHREGVERTQDILLEKGLIKIA